MKINIPHMLIGLRELQHHGSAGRRLGWKERLVYRLAREVLVRPWLYRLALRLSRWVLRRKAEQGWLGTGPGPIQGWTKSRDFPAPAARSFREQWSELE